MFLTLLAAATSGVISGLSVPAIAGKCLRGRGACSPARPVRSARQQRCYLRAQPLHESQEEVENTDEYSIFSYYLRPSFDFYQKVLWMREKVELLGPGEVRSEFAAIVGRITKMYGR